jgi:hypothetical protein
MAGFIDADFAAENLLIFDTSHRARDALAVRVAGALRGAGWTVFAFAGQSTAGYRDALPDYFVRAHTLLDDADADEVLESKRVHAKVAVVVHGLLARGAPPLDRLLRDTDVAVVAVTSMRGVRSDPQFGRIHHGASGWCRRGDPEGFEVVGRAPERPEGSWWRWWWW